MITSLRAAIAAAMLLGFYLYALAIAGALLVLTVLLSNVASGLALGKLVLVALAVPLAVLVATWRLIRAKPAPPAGLQLAPVSAPGLWAEVRWIADTVGTRAPDEIRLIAEVNAAVSEHTRLLGLVGGRRYLYLGVPLLQAVTVSQLRAILAHELGHYSHQHTRLGALTYRGGDAMVETIRQVGPTSTAGWMLRGYRRLYLLVSLAVSRRQEIEADRAAVRVAGRRAAASALREIPALDAAWAFYLNQYLGPGLDAGYAPIGVLKGFPYLLRWRADELAELRGNPPEEASRWDSHPPIGQRIRLIEAEPDSGVPTDDRAALGLFTDPDRLLDAAEDKAFHFGDRVRVPMEEYTAHATQYQVQREADRILRALARATGGRTGLAAVFDAAAAGRLPALARHLYPDVDGEELQVRFQEGVVLLLALAAVRSGVAIWRHSWSGPAQLCLPDGRPLDLTYVAGQVLSPQTLPEARARLAELGIDPGAVTMVERRASVVGAAPLAGLVNVVVDRARSDVVVLDAGLVVVPGVPRLKMRKAKPRMHDLLTSSPEQLVDLPGSRFIPVEEVAAVRAKRAPQRYELALHDGGLMKIRWGGESDEVGPGWAALAHVLAGAAGVADEPAASQAAPS
jgi:Zn-dependent protease with chaperone function